MSTRASLTLSETLDDQASSEGRPEARSPGIVLVFCERAPTLLARALGDGPLRIGRDELARAGLRDDRISREHAVVQRESGTVVVRDLGSRNGT
jgi:hypothetical protein